MPEIKKTNFIKKDISKTIHSKIGFSFLYIEEVTNDLLSILINILNTKELNIKNFFTFKILDKNERVGRNPKTNIEYKINSRKVVKFKISKSLINKLNK